jgi:hypothetical protein
VQKSESTSESPRNVFSITGSHNTVSNVHVGNVNVPEARLQLEDGRGTANADGTYTTIIPAQIIAPYVPGSLRIEAWAEGIISMEVIAQRSGMQMGGHCGTRPDHAFYTVMNPFGQYHIQVQTREPVNLEIRHRFNQ